MEELEQLIRMMASDTGMSEKDDLYELARDGMIQREVLSKSPTPGTVQQFIERIKQELDTFGVLWEKGHAEDAEIFPSEMEPQDWFEQFLVSIEVKE